jgi:hypothetical protein
VGSIDVFETSTGDGSIEVLTAGQRVDLNRGLGNRRQSALGTLALRSQTAESTGVVRNILLCLFLELGLEVLQESGIKILSTQVGITGGSLNGEDTT